MAKLLILDDSREILEMLQAVLQIHKHTVSIAEKADRFMEELHHDTPDLILMDVSLNKADGRVLCLQVKSIPATAPIPIILISANPNFLKSYGDYFADAVLEKPFDINHLTATINKLLDKAV